MEWNENGKQKYYVTMRSCERGIRTRNDTRIRYYVVATQFATLKLVIYIMCGCGYEYGSPDGRKQRKVLNFSVL